MQSPRSQAEIIFLKQHQQQQQLISSKDMLTAMQND